MTRPGSSSSAAQEADSSTQLSSLLTQLCRGNIADAISDPPFAPPPRHACSLVETLGPFAGMQHLDVAGGTGDVAFRVLRAIRAAEQQQQQVASQPTQPQAPQQPPQQQQQQPQSQQRPVPGHVTVFDINAEMLEVGRRRAEEQGETGQRNQLHLAKASRWKQLWLIGTGLCVLGNTLQAVASSNGLGA